jgi:hypothetical protein
MKLIFGMHPYFNPARRNMEDTLNIFKMEDDLNFLKKEDDLNFFENGGRRPQKIMQPIKKKNDNSFENGRQRQFLLKEDDLNFLKKWKTTSK